jgi:hypothetical protein
MPSKSRSQAGRRSPSPRPRDWSSYDASLRQRGSLIVWFSPAAMAGWKAAPRTTPGGQALYSALAILTALTLRSVLHLGLRQTEGLVGSMVQLLGLNIAVPDHTTLSRRSGTVVVPRLRRPLGAGPIHLIVDSTGLKFHGPGEWTVEKHGTKTRKSWRKLHLGVDAETGEIVASTLTDKEVDDASQVETLLGQLDVDVDLASFTADGAYDSQGVSSTVLGRHPGASLIVPPRANATLSDTAQTLPTQRDRHLISIQKIGRQAWEQKSGYTKQAHVENANGRYKQIIGPALRAKEPKNQQAEVKIGIHILNVMNKLGKFHAGMVA